MEKATGIIIGCVTGCVSIIFISMIIVVIALFVNTKQSNNNVNSNYPIDSSKSTTQRRTGSDCYYYGKSLQPSPYIKAALKTLGEGGEAITINKDSYTLDEIGLYSFGFDITDNPTGSFVEYELCDIKNNASLNYPDFTKQDYMFYEPIGTGYSGFTMSASTQFTYGNGESKTFIESSGIYSVDVFSASENGDWEWVNRLQFKVE